MTIQQINIGAFPNDATGDPARTAFTKINQNFATIGTQTSVSAFNADPTGGSDSTPAFIAALASGGPIFVPWTPNFYAVTALTAAQVSALWGPGLIKIAGVAQPISTQASPLLTAIAASGVQALALAPATNTANGSVGFGAVFNMTVRSGGFGQYGNVLNEYLVTANIPSTQFDNAVTGWVTATNMTGGQLFAGWEGANSPSSALGEIMTGGAIVGREINVGNRWADWGLQTDVGGLRYSVALQIVPDVVPSTDTSQTTVTMSTGTPGVVNWAAHGLPANTPVTFSGAIPAALTAGTAYYVAAAGLTTNAFQVSATFGGASINFAGGSTGAAFGIPSFPGTFGTVTGASVHQHKWWVANLLRTDTLMPGGHVNLWNGGSSATGYVPQDMVSVGGFWVNGMDFASASYSGSIFKVPLFAATWNSSGYGTPTNVAITASLPGTSSTLAQVGGTLAGLIATLKGEGLLNT